MRKLLLLSALFAVGCAGQTRSAVVPVAVTTTAHAEVKKED